MALPIVPVLLSLLASLTPTSRTGNDIVVRAVDGSGAPVVGVAVRVVGVVQPDFRPLGWGTYFSEYARGSTDARGEVRFDAERLHDPRVPGADLRVEPCLPTRDELAVALTSDALPKEPLVITLPPLARIEFELPSKPNARVRLMRASTERDAPLRANERVACLAWTRDGRGPAVLPHVGLGLRFEAALTWDGLMGEHVFSFAGPTRAGETTVVPDATAAKLLVFDGRALDGRGTPLARATLTVQTWIGCATSFTGAGCDVRTDADGRFHVEAFVPEQEPTDGRFGLRLAHTPPWSAALHAALLPVEAPTRAGRRALGDVQLELDTVERQLEAYSDDALEAALRKSLFERSRRAGMTTDWVLQLAEAVRRGGPRWRSAVEVLAAQELQSRALAARREYGAEREHDDPDSGPDPVAYERRVLDSLRRLQGRPAPVALEVIGGPDFEARFPELPTLPCRLRNVDPTERVHVEFWQLEDDAMLLGAPTARIEPRVRGAILWRGRPPDIDVQLAPGEEIAFTLDLGESHTLNEPGEHELRLALDEDGAWRNGTHAGASALVSAPFRVKLTVDPIRLTRATYDGLRKDLTSIARDTCVKLVRAPWTTATVFVQDDLEPQDRIFHAGWEALPVLIDALDDPKVEARHQEWALGLLFDVTGLHQPAGDSNSASLIGRTCWEDVWPTTRRDLVFSDDRGNGYVVPDGTTLADLKTAWKALRAQLDVVVE